MKRNIPKRFIYINELYVNQVAATNISSSCNLNAWNIAKNQILQKYIDEI